MANIRITSSDKKSYNEKGNLTFEAQKTVDNEIVITGRMTTHKYIEDIDKIETHRYILKGVDVFKEVFGSDDFDILYEFIAKDYIVKNGETNLSNELIESIEKKMYELEDSKLWEGDD